MSNSIAPGSSANVNVRVTALTTNPNVPVQYKTKILHKNLVNGVNTLTQAMINQTNTKYVIKYNYTLGENITVPSGCILEFDGGSINGNGTNKNTITGQNTFVEGHAESFVNNSIVIAGTWDVDKIILPKDTDVTAIVQKMLDLFGYVKFGVGTYYISDTIIIRNSNSIICGCSSQNSIIAPNPELQSTIPVVFKTLMPGEEGTSSGSYYIVGMITIKDLQINGTINNERLFENAIIINGPSSTVDNLRIAGLTGSAVGMGCWCNRVINCVISHYTDKGVYTYDNYGPANNFIVNKCRIESGKYGVWIGSGNNSVIRDNTIESNSITDVFLIACSQILIEGNYFEGNPILPKEKVYIQENSTVATITNDVKAHIVLSGSLVEEDCLFAVGSTYPPSSVVITSNFIEANLNQPDKCIVAVGSCFDGLIISNNYSRFDRTVATFFSFGMAKFMNVEIKNNFSSNDSKLNPLKIVTTTSYLSSSWQGSEHFKGSISLDYANTLQHIIGDNVNIFGSIRDEFLSIATQSLKQIDGNFITELDFTDLDKRNCFGFSQEPINGTIYRFECDIKLSEGTVSADNIIIIYALRYYSGGSYDTSCKVTLSPNNDWMHVVLNIDTPENLVNELGIQIFKDTSPAGKTWDTKYLIKNPILYKVTLNKPECNYYIKESKYVHQGNTDIVRFNTRNSPIGIRGINKNDVPCIVTGHDANGYDIWSTIDSLLNPI